MTTWPIRALLWVLEGEELWRKGAGIAGKSCATAIARRQPA